MSWDPKYTCEYTDILGLDWKWDFEFDGSFTTTPLQASGGPQPIEFLSQGDDLTDNPIKGSKADLTIETETDFQWENLCPNEDQLIRCKIYAGVNLFWQGYVIADNLSEPYNRPRYSVVISASDGLGLLKTIPYDDSGTPYNGRTLESQIILDILAKIGHTGFTEYVNIYETRMDGAVGDSPIDQTAIDVDVFADMNCYEVLEQLLKKYNAIIRQKNGEFIIYRPKELTGATVYGRVFTAATTKSATSFNPVQYISRPGNLTDIRDIENGTLMRKSAAKKISLMQDYGYKDTWVDNSLFAADTWDGTDFDLWTPVVSGHIAPISDYVTGEKDGVIVTSGTLGSLYQVIGTYAVLSTTDLFTIEFDYGFYNVSISDKTGIDLYIGLMQSTTKILEDAGDNTTLNWVNIAGSTPISITEDVPVGWTGWKTWSRQFTGLPLDHLSLKILTYPTSDASNVYACYKNIKIYASSLQILEKVRANFDVRLRGQIGTTHLKGYNLQINNIVENTYTATTVIEGQELEFDYKLGDVTDTILDNVIEQFAGSLAIKVITGYTGEIDKVDTAVFHASSGSGTVSCNGHSHPIVWVTTVADTLDAFMTLWSTGYGTVALTRTATDTIIFSGSSDFTDCSVSASFGTATVTTEYFIGDPVYGYDYTTTWAVRGGAERNLLQLVCNEIRDQYARTRQLLNIPILENNTTGTGIHLNLIGNFQDDYNKLSGNNRKFAFNRGVFNTIDRECNINLVEII